MSSKTKTVGTHIFCVCGYKPKYTIWSDKDGGGIHLRCAKCERMLRSNNNGAMSKHKTDLMNEWVETCQDLEPSWRYLEIQGDYREDILGLEKLVALVIDSEEDSIERHNGKILWESYKNKKSLVGI